MQNLDAIGILAYYGQFKLTLSFLFSHITSLFSVKIVCKLGLQLNIFIHVCYRLFLNYLNLKVFGFIQVYRFPLMFLIRHISLLFTKYLCTSRSRVMQLIFCILCWQQNTVPILSLLKGSLGRINFLHCLLRYFNRIYDTELTNDLLPLWANSQNYPTGWAQQKDNW